MSLSETGNHTKHCRVRNDTIVCTIFMSYYRNENERGRGRGYVTSLSGTRNLLLVSEKTSEILYLSYSETVYPFGTSFEYSYNLLLFS